MSVEFYSTKHLLFDLLQTQVKRCYRRTIVPNKYMLKVTSAKKAQIA